MVNPLSGGLLAVHTLVVKYTSQVYLESLPHLLSILAVLTFVRASKILPDKWFWISALCLGAATAGKFTYIPVIVIVLGYLFFFKKNNLRKWLIPYSILALISFFALDITLWHDPFRRLVEAVTFHASYSQGMHVQEVGYPWFQPFIWVFTSFPAEVHPEVFFYFGFDGIISILGISAIKHEWTERRWLVIWFVAGMFFLLIWPTKWPQYVLIVTPALCIMAAGTLHRLINWVREKDVYWDYTANMLPAISKPMWVLLGIFLSMIIFFYSSAAIKLAVGQIGWSHLTKDNSSLPSNTVYKLLLGSYGEMVIATDKGIAFLNPNPGDDQSGKWVFFNTSNSELPNNNVLSLARGKNNELWIGTESGLAKYDSKTWKIFHSNDLGLQNDHINSISVGADGNIFIGTMSGVSRWDGSAWNPVGSYSDKKVFDIVITNKHLFVATLGGVYESDLLGNGLAAFPTRAPVLTLLLDSNNKLWAGTSEGLAQLDGDNWRYLDTTNSGLPLNIVTAITEITPGVFWIGTSNTANIGGLISSFDGKAWRTFERDNSGYSGAEPLSIIPGLNGQIWIATRTLGLDIFNIGDNK
jgi:hypothetical protein